jgi:hypothetical protein
MTDELDPKTDPEADHGPSADPDPPVIEDLDVPGDDVDSVTGGSFVFREGSE